MNRATLIPADREKDLRIVVAGAFGVAAVWPLLPVHPPLACPLRAATGIPCPFCGMTRACVAAVHGHVLQSLAFNPVGILLLVAAAVVVIRPSLLRSLRPPPTWTLWAALGAMWIWNVGFNPTFHQLLLR